MILRALYNDLSTGFRKTGRLHSFFAPSPATLCCGCDFRKVWIVDFHCQTAMLCEEKDITINRINVV